METVTCTLYESSPILFDADKRPVRRPGRLIATFKVSGETVDARRAAAQKKAKQMTGRRPAVSCTTDGNLTATVSPR